MKFTIAVVLVALAAGSAFASPIWGAGPVVSVDLGHHHGAWDLGHGDAWGHGGAWGHGAVIASHGLGHIVGHGHGPTLVQGHSVQSAGHGWAGHAAVAGHHGHGHEASYVASNRGSVHVAPLAGHIASVSSSNVAPAPGTTW